eukprot:Skav202315  [mRNA]  locus=scaffold60:213308:215015:+ [translate_table: standard]
MFLGIFLAFSASPRSVPETGLLHRKAAIRVARAWMAADLSRENLEKASASRTAGGTRCRSWVVDPYGEVLAGEVPGRPSRAGEVYATGLRITKGRGAAEVPGRSEDDFQNIVLISDQFLSKV